MCSQFLIGDDEVVSNCSYDREDENATDTQYLLAGTPDVLLTLSHIRDAAADATQVATFVLADLAIWPPHLPVSLAEQPSLVIFDVAEPSTPSTFDGSVPRALVHSGLSISPLVPIDAYTDDFQFAPARVRYALSIFRGQCLKLILWDCHIMQLVGWDSYAEHVCTYHAAESVWQPYTISLEVFRSLPLASDFQLLACSSGTAGPAVELAASLRSFQVGDVVSLPSPIVRQILVEHGFPRITPQYDNWKGCITSALQDGCSFMVQSICADRPIRISGRELQLFN
jgi:hypothetical protein